MKIITALIFKYENNNKSIILNIKIVYRNFIIN